MRVVYGCPSLREPDKQKQVRRQNNRISDKVRQIGTSRVKRTKTIATWGEFGHEANLQATLTSRIQLVCCMSGISFADDLLFIPLDHGRLLRIEGWSSYMDAIHYVLEQKDD